VTTSADVAVAVSNAASPDTTVPTAAITTPTSNASISGIVAVAAAASDNVGVSRVDFYLNGTLRAAVNAAPYNFTWDTRAETNGANVLSCRAYDAAGNVGMSSSISVTVNNPVPDLMAPVISSFTLPATATSLTVAIGSLTAGDNVGVTGYPVSETATAPGAGAAGWLASAPTSFTFAGSGSRTAYAWVKDAAGNVSASRSAPVTITLPDVAAPLVSTFALPATATSLTVAITSFTASDNVGVTGYRVSETATAPGAGAAGWLASAPTSFTFATAGSRTAYAWVKDAAGNVSASRSAPVTITLPDVAAPLVSAFTLPATATNRTVAITSFTATDNIRVTGYRVSESATTPAAGSAGWLASAPTSFTFAGSGSRTAYAWVKDAAGNISARRSATVSISRWKR